MRAHHEVKHGGEPHQEPGEEQDRDEVRHGRFLQLQGHNDRFRFLIHRRLKQHDLRLSFSSKPLDFGAARG
jgi:hypothetical protein